MSTKQYEVGERNCQALGQTYIDHVGAMTVEGLHRKTDIAAELAARDICIKQLQCTLGKIVNSKVLMSDRCVSKTNQLVEMSRQLLNTREALEAFVDMYVGTVNSGDCGNWDPETDKEVILVRKVLKE